MSLADALTLGALLAIAGLFLLANFGERYETARVLSLVAGGLLAGTALFVGILFAFVAIAVYAAGGITGSDLRSRLLFTIPLAVAGAVGILYLLPPIQRAAARLLPLAPRSPVAYNAVVLGMLFLGIQVGTQLSVDVVGELKGSAPITAFEILLQDIPLVIIAFIGVGAIARRSLPDSAGRLGLTPPRQARWWLVALLAIPAFIAIATGIEWLAGVFTPATQKQVTEVSNVLFSRFDNPAAIVFLGVTAGVAEEILFRGALLPRFGVLLTALLFAAVHTQYGVTFASLEVFILGVGLGWLRRAGGTLPCIVTHVGYDITVGLISLHR